MLTYDSQKKNQSNDPRQDHSNNKNINTPNNDPNNLMSDQELDNIYKQGSATTHLDGLRAVYAAAGEGKGLVNGGPRRELEHPSQVTSQQPFPKPPAGEAVSYDSKDGHTDFVNPNDQTHPRDHKTHPYTPDHALSTDTDTSDFKKKSKGKSNEAI